MTTDQGLTEMRDLHTAVLIAAPTQSKRHKQLSDLRVVEHTLCEYDKYRRAHDALQEGRKPRLRRFTPKT